MANKAEKFYPISFVVEGRGDFPLDMLRYDSCFPAAPDDAAAIANSLDLERRTRGVTRVRLYARAATRDGLTPARWASFLWNVVEIDGQEIRVS